MAILNKAQLQSESDSTYINNNGNLITPAAVRAFNDDLIDSVIVADQTGSMSVSSASFFSGFMVIKLVPHAVFPSNAICTIS